MACLPRMEWCLAVSVDRGQWGFAAGLEKGAADPPVARTHLRVPFLSLFSTSLPTPRKRRARERVTARTPLRGRRQTTRLTWSAEQTLGTRPLRWDGGDDEDEDHCHATPSSLSPRPPATPTRGDPVRPRFCSDGRSPSSPWRSPWDGASRPTSPGARPQP